MDYQEAIELLKGEIKCSCYRNRGYCGICTIYSELDRDKIIDACKCAISAMQELREYKENEKRNFPRTNRLMDECTYRHENGNCLKIGGFCTSVPTSHCQIYKELYNEYTEYKLLGTLEEVRDAVEKQRAKKPKNVETEGYRYTDTYRCPTCGGNFSGTGIADYCYHCGQKLNWSEVEE